MNNITIAILSILATAVCGCASTSSVMIDRTKEGHPAVAIFPLQGELGEQAADLIAEQLALNGIATVERSKLNNVMREHGFIGDQRFDQNSVIETGRLLGVSKVFFGTVSTDQSILASYPHVNITLRLVDVRTGEITWIGRYGNSLWSSAISTLGDLQRGAKHIVREFLNVHGTTF